jgi:hypothetical protein
VGLFRRRHETLNEQLLREAGLDPAQALGDTQPPKPSPEPTPSVLSIVGVPDGSRVSPREWDAATVVEAPELEGNRAEFTTLPNGDVIVEREKGDGDLSPLADAIEKKVKPPYRAVAARQDGDLWGVGAKRIQVAKFELPDGDKVELSENDGVRELRVDGDPSDAEIPELAQLGEQVGANYCVEGKRIDGDFWEVRASAL